jgi:cell division protein FtsI (penicillin-binding protein 3)
VQRVVVPRGTARIVADVLTGVTGEEGTGLEAAIDGYLVAGKTGTAQKADDRRGGYEAGLYTASFVGFAPADAPRVVIAVVIDEPMIDHYGGVVAGPVFRRVGEATLRHLGVPASGGGHVLGEISRAARERARAGARSQSAPETEITPDEPTRSEVALGERREPGDGETEVPDVRGRGARGALLTLMEAGLVPQIEGTGIVITQAPPAGAIIERGSAVRVVLDAPTWHEPVVTDIDESETHAEAASSERTLVAVARRAEGAR